MPRLPAYRIDLSRIEDEIIPVNPNMKSEHRTAASVMLDGHWDVLGLVERWTWPRYANLCSMLDLTIYEMGSLVMLPHREVDNFQRDNRLFRADLFHAKQAAFILSLLEQHYLKAMKQHDEMAHKDRAALFPKLSKAA